jgi:hypothetical protein
MEAALGVMGWTPRQFWSATPIELRSALRGWERSQGVDPDAPAPQPESPSASGRLSDEHVERLQTYMDSLPDSYVREEDAAAGI